GIDPNVLAELFQGQQGGILGMFNMFSGGALSREDIAEVRTSELEKMKATEIALAALKAEGIVPRAALAAKVIVSGKLSRKIALKALGASKGARSMIEAAGGSVTAPEKVEQPKKLPKKSNPEAKPAA
ncbi:MAG: uL15 family ribosomal protein, partial [Betaproteobacteria bacterium]